MSRIEDLGERVLYHSNDKQRTFDILTDEQIATVKQKLRKGGMKMSDETIGHRARC